MGSWKKGNALTQTQREINKLEKQREWTKYINNTNNVNICQKSKNKKKKPKKSKYLKIMDRNIIKMTFEIKSWNLKFQT